jgi:hypothetical protein
MNARSLSALGLGLALLVAGPIAPAVADISAKESSSARAAMLTERDAKKFGTFWGAKHGFTVNHDDGKSAFADRPWLCDLTGTVEVTGWASPVAYQVATLSESKQPINDPGSDLTMNQQEVFVYATTAKAKKAWRHLVQQAKRCTGTVAQNNGGDDESVVMSLANGTKKLTGGQGASVFVSSSSQISGDVAFKSHEYVVATLVGSGIQVVSFEREGGTAQPITNVDRRNLDALAGALATRWMSSKVVSD